MEYGAITRSSNHRLSAIAVWSAAITNSWMLCSRLNAAASDLFPQPLRDGADLDRLGVLGWVSMLAHNRILYTMLSLMSSPYFSVFTSTTVPAGLST